MKDKLDGAAQSGGIGGQAEAEGPGSAIIRLRGITREFVSGNGEVTRVLDNVNLDIERGSLNVISGESGSGKTTLLRILGMLDNGYEGDYLFEDVSVLGQPDWYLDELRANNLGFIFQEGRLFGHMTLRRNIELPLELHGDHQRHRLDEAVQKLEPEFFSIDERAKGTLDLQPGSASGGQGQRASIMRAMINKPSIILADEPTASLHGDLKNEVVEHLKHLSELGHTVIVVSHDEAFFGTGRQLKLINGVMHELDPGPAAAADPIDTQMPAEAAEIWRGWWPRAPIAILWAQALRETFARKLFLFLTLSALIVGVTQVSVFTSVILGAQTFVNQKITEGSRLNRVQIKPRARDRSKEDRFPLRPDITAIPAVGDVVARRLTTTRVVVEDGSAKTFAVSGLHQGDPEYRLLQFMAGGGFSGDHDRPEVILTAGLMGDVFDTTALEAGTGEYADFIGQSVMILVNRYNTSGDKVAEVPVEMKLVGVIANGEGGRQLYYPNTTLLLLDALLRDKTMAFNLPEGAGVNAWPDKAVIDDKTGFPWEDALQVYVTEIQDVLGVYAQLSKLGHKPKSDIWDFKWALDIQDTAWRIFLPMLGLIVTAVSITVFANIIISAQLRVTELALWRVLGMRRGDLVLTQVVSIAISVTAGALAGLALGGLMIEQVKSMLMARSLETAAASGEDAQDFEAIFAPLGDFFWQILLAAVVIGVLAAIFPAIRTAGTDPAKVLKS